MSADSAVLGGQAPLQQPAAKANSQARVHVEGFHHQHQPALADLLQHRLVHHLIQEVFGVFGGGRANIKK